MYIIYKNKKVGENMNYKNEFPNFNLTVKIPNDFMDVSWHNDISPSFEKILSNKYIIMLWVNYSDPDDREISEHNQFLATILMPDKCEPEEALSSNNYKDILKWIKQIENKYNKK